MFRSRLLRLLLLGLPILLSVRGKDARFNAQQGELVAQEGELVGNLDKSVWTSPRRRRSRTMFMEMCTSVGSEYHLRHLRSSACGTRLRAGPHSWRRFAFFEDNSPAQAGLPSLAYVCGGLAMLHAVDCDRRAICHRSAMKSKIASKRRLTDLKKKRNKGALCARAATNFARG